MLAEEGSGSEYTYNEHQRTVDISCLDNTVADSVEKGAAYPTDPFCDSMFIENREYANCGDECVDYYCESFEDEVLDYGGDDKVKCEELDDLPNSIGGNDGIPILEELPGGVQQPFDDPPISSVHTNIQGTTAFITSTCTQSITDHFDIDASSQLTADHLNSGKRSFATIS